MPSLWTPEIRLAFLAARARQLKLMQLFANRASTSPPPPPPTPAGPKFLIPRLRRPIGAAAPAPLAAKSLSTDTKATNPDKRLRQHTDQQADVTNALSLSGQLIQVKDKDFTIGARFRTDRAPTAADDVTLGAAVGALWINAVGIAAYICIDNTTGAAVWIPVASGVPLGPSGTFNSGAFP